MSRRYIYVAAAFGERASASQLATALRGYGYTIVSTWHETAETVDPRTQAERRGIARSCLNEIDQCDTVVVIQAGRPRGAYFEAGYAHALRRTIVWVDNSGPVFDSLERARVAPVLGSAREIADEICKVLS